MVRVTRACTHRNTVHALPKKADICTAARISASLSAIARYGGQVYIALKARNRFPRAAVNNHPKSVRAPAVGSTREGSMADEAHDSWLGVLGIDVDQIRNKVQGVVSDIQTTVDKGIDTVVQGATQLYKDADNAVTQTVQTVENMGGKVINAVSKGVDAAKMKALGDQSGSPVPRPLEAD